MSRKRVGSMATSTVASSLKALTYSKKGYSERELPASSVRWSAGGRSAKAVPAAMASPSPNATQSRSALR